MKDLFLTFSWSRTQSAKPSSLIIIKMTCMFLHFGKIMNFHNALHLCRCKCWHCFLMSFGIDVDSMFETVWLYFQFSLAIDV